MTDEETRKIFAKRLTDLLYVQRLTARDLANKIGVSEGSMTQYKKGAYLPKGYILQDIADALNVTTDFLLGNDQPQVNDGTIYLKKKPAVNTDDPGIDYELNIISHLSELTDDAKQLVSVTVDALRNGNQNNARILKAYFDALNRICRSNAK